MTNDNVVRILNGTRFAEAQIKKALELTVKPNGKCTTPESGRQEYGEGVVNCILFG